jgi:hypothetical protein
VTRDSDFRTDSAESRVQCRLTRRGFSIAASAPLKSVTIGHPRQMPHRRWRRRLRRDKADHRSTELERKPPGGGPKASASRGIKGGPPDAVFTDNLAASRASDSQARAAS